MTLRRVHKLYWLLSALIFLATSIGFFEFSYSDKYYPGVMVAGESVRNRTYEEVLQEFQAKSDTLLKNGLNLEFERGNSKEEINIPAMTTGLTSDTIVEYFSIVDLEETIARAYNWGRTGSIMQRLQEQLALLSGKNFDSLILPHKEAIQSLLSRETKNFFKTKAPAQFSFDKNGKAIIIPEKPGDNIDIEKTVAVILRKFKVFEIQPIIFEVESEIPYTTEERLAPFLDLAKEFAESANVNFYYQNHTWKVSGRTLATWLTLKPNNQITIDTEKLEAFLSASVTPFINDPPQNSRFEMRDGSLVEISPGKSGDVVNVRKTIELIEEIVPYIQQSSATANIQTNPKNNTIDIPIETITIDPQITQKTIDQYNIKDLVGYARTNFAGGSLDRQHNIEVGISKLTGVLIAPGEEFSTTRTLGEVTEEAGFVKEFVIKDNQTVKELGGGLCQLATTLFRTALNAGLPITERTNHRYVIPYYGPGLDATIYDPHPDFRFVNDTKNYLLLQGTAKNNEAIFELYGVADGRVAEIGIPVLSDEKPVPENRVILSPDLPMGVVNCTIATHKGITADTTYTVRYSDGSTKEQTFHSVYEAWPKVCLVGTSIAR